MQYTLHMDGTRYRFVRQDRGLLRSMSSREQYQDGFAGPRRARPRRVLNNTDMYRNSVRWREGESGPSVSAPSASRSQTVYTSHRCVLSQASATSSMSLGHHRILTTGQSPISRQMAIRSDLRSTSSCRRQTGQYACSHAEEVDREWSLV